MIRRFSITVRTSFDVALVTPYVRPPSGCNCHPQHHHRYSGHRTLRCTLVRVCAPTRAHRRLSCRLPSLPMPATHTCQWLITSGLLIQTFASIMFYLLVCISLFYAPSLFYVSFGNGHLKAIPWSCASLRSRTNSVGHYSLDAMAYRHSVGRCAFRLQWRARNGQPVFHFFPAYQHRYVMCLTARPSSMCVQCDRAGRAKLSRVITPPCLS